MADILQTTFQSVFPWMKTIVIYYKISVNFLPMGQNDNDSALVQVIARHQTAD